MKKRILLPLLGILILIAGRASGQNTQSFDPTKAYYLWPTEASHYLSSTFGETRSAHFHAALDIKTWGQRGYEVYATRDGIVDRIAIGPTGYGKVIYLKHDDGSRSIYAHLLSFNDQLQQMADSIRFAEGYQFEIDRYLGWKDIKVEQGQVIGYTGASGIGPPHLHFELRTPSDKPFNPLLTNLDVEDNIAPQFLGISVEPLSPFSAIEGENAIYKRRLWGKKSSYDAGTISVSGPVGLGVNVFDQSNKVHNSYAVYKLQMTVDGKKFFEAKVDSFSYHETDQMFIDRVYPILQKEGDGYQRLYTADGNTLSFYSTNASRGVIDLEPGLHDVSIRATDFHGNETSVQLQLSVKPDSNNSLPALTKRVSKQSQDSPHQWNWFANWLTFSESQYGQVTIGTADSTKFRRFDNGISLNLSSFDNLYTNIPGMSPVMLQRVKPASENIISDAELKNFAIFPKGAVYDTVSVGMSVKHFEDDSITVDMLPDAYPLRNAYSFYINRSAAFDDTAQMSFYKYDREDDEWDLIPTRFEKQYIIGKTESLGSFALKRDTTAPKLSHPRLSKRPDGQWLVMINATDNLSGIDYGRTEITVNGIRGIAEFEPEDDRLVYYHPAFVPTSSMDINIIVHDKMGNQRQASYHLTRSSTKK